MIISVHQPQYLPWLGYFDKIDKSDCFVFLDTVQYKKREFQNRNRIRTQKGCIWLTVPVKTKGLDRQNISDVYVDNEIDWADSHSKSLQMWYGTAPYFSRYYPFFKDVYSKKWKRLIDLNICIIEYILKQLDIKTKIYLESDIGTTEKSTQRIIEICKKLKADVYLSGTGGKAYLAEDEFSQNSIGLRYQKFNHPEYAQRFIDDNNPFTPYMSVIDLLFNEGPNSIAIIRGQE
jgi:hypothetical protein